jgi:hypothetical protein
MLVLVPFNWHIVPQEGNHHLILGYFCSTIANCFVRRKDDLVRE